MESRSRRRLRRSPPPPQHGAGDLDGDDRISALPDDMLLQVLVRLGCARAAARTGLVSRRWRGLWARLPGLTFRDFAASVIQLALSRFGLNTAVSFIEIRLSRSTPWKLDDGRAKALLRAAARLSPEVLIFTLPVCNNVKVGRPVDIVMPCFGRAKSIELDTRFLRIKPPKAGDLPALETLSISGNIVDLGSLLDRCPRLRLLGVTFRRVDPDSLDAGLAALEAAASTLGLVVSRLGIELDRGFEFEYIDLRHSVDGAHFASILRTAARLSPQELIFRNNFCGLVNADLLCFRRATSIEMNLCTVRFTQLPDGEFSALERFCLTESSGIVDIAAFVSRCPRLRVLKVTADKSERDITIHSASLQELEIYVDRDTTCRGVDIMTPALKLLNFTVHSNTDLSVSMSAPVMEKVSWHCSYKECFVFGFWSLRMLKVETVESYKEKEWMLSNNEGEDLCTPLPRIHVLSLHVYAYDRLGVVVDFAHEIEKLPVTNFSILEVHISPRGHVYGAFLFSLFEMHHLRTATQSLKVILQGCEMKKEPECVGNCPCDEPRDWRSQNISLDNLVEVEIDNFGGEALDINFLISIFRWAPMLKRMTVRISSWVIQPKFKACAMETHNIFVAHPSVNCSLLRHGKLVQQTSIQ